MTLNTIQGFIITLRRNQVLEKFNNELRSHKMTNDWRGQQNNNDLITMISLPSALLHRIESAYILYSIQSQHMLQSTHIAQHSHSIHDNTLLKV